MALDCADQLQENGDIPLVRSDKYRVYNLLHKSDIFVDNLGIGLDIAAMVEMGIGDESIEGFIIDYLLGFSVDLRGMALRSEKGNIILDYNFGGSLAGAAKGDTYV